MSQSTHEGAHIPVASDIMVRELVTLSEDTPILEAMATACACSQPASSTRTITAKRAWSETT
jgi:hypothetical protein